MFIPIKALIRELTDNVFLDSVANDDVQLQRDLASVFNERSDRTQKRSRTFFNVHQFLPVVRVTGIFPSALSFSLADVTATSFPAVEVFSPTSEPQQSKLSAANP